MKDREHREEFFNKPREPTVKARNFKKYEPQRINRRRIPRKEVTEIMKEKDAWIKIRFNH